MSRSDTSLIDMTCFKNSIAETFDHRGQELQLERPEVDRAHRRRPVFVVAVIDPRTNSVSEDDNDV